MAWRHDSRLKPHRLHEVKAIVFSGCPMLHRLLNLWTSLIELFRTPGASCVLGKAEWTDGRWPVPAGAMSSWRRGQHENQGWLTRPAMSCIGKSECVSLKAPQASDST